MRNDVCTSRRDHIGLDETALTGIYQDNVNMAIWRRNLSRELQMQAKQCVEQHPKMQLSAVVDPASALDTLRTELPSQDHMKELLEDMATLVDMFCCLFDCKRAGLRLKVLNSAMCPRFHVDNVPCRLVTTYIGIATEWLAHNHVNRDKLGPGNQGLPDEESGLYHHSEQIQHLSAGHVALMKGEKWHNNQGAGLVHRSPEPSQSSRLLLTLDFVDA